MTISLQEVSEVVKIAGLGAAGLWTAWTFQKLQKTRAAEVENNRKLAEIQKSHLEQQELRTRLLRQQPQLAVEITIAELARPKDMPGNCLCVTVIMKNEGDQNFEVYFDNSTLIAGRIVFQNDGMQALREVHRSGPWYCDESDTARPLAGRVFRVGQKRQLAFAVPITEAGAYFIQFHAVYFKIPFEGEKPFQQDPIAIHAIEQTICFANGGSAG